MLSRGSRQRERKATGISREIVDLSIRYGLISRETSFVAIERREAAVTGDIQLRRIPIALTSGWGGLQDELLSTHFHAARAMPSSLAPTHSSAVGPAAFSLASAHEEIQMLKTEPPKRPFLSRALEGLSRARRPSSAAQPPGGMHALIALQGADGSWDLTRELCAIIGHELTALEAVLSGATGHPDEMRRAWATAMALVWLAERAGGSEDEWRLLAAKAHRFLDAVAAVPQSRGSWFDAAKRFERQVTS